MRKEIYESESKHNLCLEEDYMGYLFCKRCPFES